MKYEYCRTQRMCGKLEENRKCSENFRILYSRKSGIQKCVFIIIKSTQKIPSVAHAKNAIIF